MMNPAGQSITIVRLRDLSPDKWRTRHGTRVGVTARPFLSYYNAVERCVTNGSFDGPRSGASLAGNLASVSDCSQVSVDGTVGSVPKNRSFYRIA